MRRWDRTGGLVAVLLFVAQTLVAQTQVLPDRQEQAVTAGEVAAHPAAEVGEVTAREGDAVGEVSGRHTGLGADREGGGASADRAEVAPRASWQWPLRGPREVVKPFDPPAKRWLPGHRGVDLAGYSYAPVLAVADGTVTYSGNIAGVGIVSITHPDGIRSTYQPVTERVDEGTEVAAGEVIGYLGAIGSHCRVRTCLHLGAVRGKDHYLDPLLLLQVWELTLLPHGE